MAPGWFFKKGKPKKVFPAKYNIRPRVRGSTMTTVAKVMAEQGDPEKAAEEGHAVLYRKRNRPPGFYLETSADRKEIFLVDTSVVPKTIFGEYATTPRSKRPPLVNAIYDRIQQKVEELNPRRQALSIWNHIQVRDDPFIKLFYFFSGNCGFFVERDYAASTIRMSRDYESATARALYKSERWDKIRWLKVEATPPCVPPD